MTFTNQKLLQTRVTTLTSIAPKIPSDQLDSLVAPIALYPTPLLTQTLVASTYPLKIICPGRPRVVQRGFASKVDLSFTPGFSRVPDGSAFQATVSTVSQQDP